MVVGCFCIGTNQVDLDYCSSRGIPVFNSPFSNSRSVAEMVISLCISLSRQIGQHNNSMHKRIVESCHNPMEIRGKIIGIVGYGHIGSQLSVLAESLGMTVVYYDIIQVMPLGKARPVNSLAELLHISDFVSLHVPETNETKLMITRREINLMKKGSFLINASRGSVVQIPDLADALKSGYLAGAAVDVYPTEPFSNGHFESELIGCPNTILSPHIGGSTEEAQSSIGIEVANAIVKYLSTGSTTGSVNFPETECKPVQQNTARIINVHKNVPGVLRQINNILDSYTVEKQVCDSKGNIAYFVADISNPNNDNLISVYDQLCNMKGIAF
jgi:D-3-phosphoglycerate dehydrogenase